MQSQSHLSSYLSLRNVTGDVGPKVFCFFHSVFEREMITFNQTDHSN
jgi:hypothetical protein